MNNALVSVCVETEAPVIASVVSAPAPPAGEELPVSQVSPTEALHVLHHTEEQKCPNERQKYISWEQISLFM